MATTQRHGEGIDDKHRVELTGGHYGRPQFRVSYYSQSINARAMATFETRHEAVGYITVRTREGRMERPKVAFREDYDHRPSSHYK